METAAPTKFGKYDVVGVLGKGAMGIVYDCRDPVIGRRVAIKTVLKEALDSSEAESLLGRFKQEAQAAGRLNHPGVVSIYDYGETESVAFIAMEYISGKELKKYFDEGEKFDLKEIVRIMSDILDALEHAHRNKVVHRDIKPANIMITDDGRVKVADFGVAKIESSLATQIGTRVGTPAYMAPEQHRMLSVDGRSDLFSCGVILYQFLTGARPFTGGSQTIARNILTQTPTPPSEINATLTPVWDSIVRKALAKRPDERFQSAREFIEALRGGLGNPPGALDGLAFSPGGGTSLKTAPGWPPEPPSTVSRAAISTNAGKPERTDIAMESELEFWKEIKDSDHPEDFVAFVESFPDGRFSHLAKRRLDKLKQASNRAQEDETLLSVGHAPVPQAPAAAPLKRVDTEADATHLPRDNGVERAQAERARTEAEDRARAEAEARQREETDRRARQEAEERAAREETARAQRATEERERQRLQQEAARAATEKAQQEAQELARREAEAQRLRELEVQARKEVERREAEERAQKEAEARKAAEQLRQREREAHETERLRLETEAQARRDEQERQRKADDATAARAAKEEKELAEQRRREAQQAEREAKERARSEAQAQRAAADSAKAEAARSKREAEDNARRDTSVLHEMDATVVRGVDADGSPAKALADPDPDATQIRDVDATISRFRSEEFESGHKSGGVPQAGTGQIGAGATAARRQNEEHAAADKTALTAVDIDLSEGATATSHDASTDETVAYQVPGGTPLQLPSMPLAVPPRLSVARAVTVTTREPEVETETKKRPVLLMAGVVMALVLAGAGWFHFASKPATSPGASEQTAQGASPFKNQERAEAERQPKDAAPKDSVEKAGSTPSKAPDTSGSAEAPSAKETAEQRKTEQDKQNQAAEKAAEAKLAIDKGTADKLAADKAAITKLAQEKATADKGAAVKSAADKAATDKLAAEKAAADRVAADRAAADKLAAEKAAADRVAADRAAADKLAAEKGAADKAAADRAAAEKSAAERVNSANSVADRIAAASAPAELYKRAVALRGEGKTALAVALLRQASSQGHGPSSRLLAAIYKDGAADVRADFRQAERFQALADTQGDR